MRRLFVPLLLCFISTPNVSVEAGDFKPSTTASWTSIPPVARFDHSSAYDSRRERMIVYGGVVGSDRNFETWAFSLKGQAKWTRIAPGEGAPPSSGGVLLYDPVRDQVLFLFGSTASPLKVWSLPLHGSATWSELQVQGDPPIFASVFGYDAALYDPLRDRFLVLMSNAVTSKPGDGIYALLVQDENHARWKRLTSDLPQALHRVGFGVVHDLAQDRLVLFGGGQLPRGCFDLGSCLKPLADTWMVDLRDSSLAWSPLVPNGIAPEARVAPFAAYDLDADRMIVYGGQGGQMNPYPLGDTWELRLGIHPEWNKLDAELARAPSRESVIWDSDRRRLVQFGGTEVVARASPFISSAGTIGLVRELSPESGEGWEVADPSDPVPSARTGHTLTYDPGDRQWILFGGARDDSAVWVLPERGPAVWRVLKIHGDGPSPRAFHTAAYDSVTRSLLVFGGMNMRTLGLLADVWRLTLTNPPTWTKIEPGAEGPGKRAWHGAVMDAWSRRMVVFGGRDSTFHPTDELWQLTFDTNSTWTQIDAAGETPGPMAHLSLVYDSSRRRAILVSGSSGARDVWSLELTGDPRWAVIAHNGPLVADNGATIDAAGDRLIVLNATFLFKPWELPLSALSDWRPIAVEGEGPSLREGPIACNSRGDALALFGGAARANLSDLWILSLPKSEGRAMRATTEGFGTSSWQMSLAPPHPNPSRSDVVIAYTQPARARVTIRVFDGGGRLVRMLFDGMSDPGSHEISWNGLEGGGGRARAGVYYCAMKVGDWSTSRKFVLLSP